MAVLCIMLSMVCISDYRSTRIPNGMIAAIFLYGLGYRCWDTGISGAVEWLFNCVSVLLFLYPLFKIRAVGAGDVKLLSVTCGCLSKQSIACFLVVSLLIAAMISTIKLCKDGRGAKICLTGPILMSLLLHAGGVY